MRCFVRVFLYTQTAVDAGDMQLTNHSYFDYGKPEDPQLEPHDGIKMVQVLGSPLYICVRALINHANGN